MTKNLSLPLTIQRSKSEKVKNKPQFQRLRNQINLQSGITGKEGAEEMVEAICSDFKEHVFIEKEQIFHGKSKTIFRSRH